MRSCPDCKKANSDYIESCQYCGASLTKPVYAGLGSSYGSSKYSSPSASQSQSNMSIVLYVFGVLSLIGGFILCAMVWSESYIIGLSCLFSGIISGVVFYAIGRILETVLAIYDSAAMIQHDLKNVKGRVEAAVTKE